MNKFRIFLYALARLLGDVNAVRKGPVGKRIARRAAGKATLAVCYENYSSRGKSYENGKSDKG